MPDNLSPLLSRLRQAERGDRELDTLVCAALRHIKTTERWARDWEGEWRAATAPTPRVQLINDRGDVAAWFHPERVTTDVSAALALVEAKLPGWDWMLRDLGGGVEAAVAPRVHRQDGLPRSRKKLGLWIKSGHCATAALALCCVLLSALEAQDHE